jgi:hypothetical protein
VVTSAKKITEADISNTDHQRSNAQHDEKDGGNNGFKHKK